MSFRAKLTTKGVGFGLIIAVCILILTMMFFTTKALKPITETRLEECAERLETYKQQLDEVSQDRDKYSTEDEYSTAVKNAEKKVTTYETRINMLNNREANYTSAMVFLVLVLVSSIVAGFALTSFVNSKNRFVEASEYIPLFDAPLAAVCLLLAIGVSFQSIIAFTSKDLIILIGSVIVGVIAFFVYRVWPYFTAKMENRKKPGSRFSAADMLYWLLVVVIALITLATALFGVEVNGAKIWFQISDFRFQPGEFIKVLLVVLYAFSYGKKWRAISSMVVSAFVAASYVMLDDLGMLVVVAVMTLIMILLLLDNKMTFSFMENKKLLFIALIILVCGFALALKFSANAQSRIEIWGTALVERSGQQADMLKALILGGVDGLGFENSSYILNIYAIQTDLTIAGITAVFGYGMLFIVLICYALLIIVPLREFSVYRSYYFATAQISAVLFTQVILNALGSIDVLPFTGVVAPFLSNGGSAMASFCAMAGMLMASLHPVIKPLEVNG